ncbi:MAG TPA: hypothetical protein DCR97_08085 [Deltaproteobacteria bacterium]|nr:hypothetical protein [Deltaproteobacteria bacterium]
MNDATHSIESKDAHEDSQLSRYKYGTKMQMPHWAECLAVPCFPVIFPAYPRCGAFCISRLRTDYTEIFLCLWSGYYRHFSVNLVVILTAMETIDLMDLRNISKLI